MIIMIIIIIHSWLTSNCLRLNSDRTKLMWCSSECVLVHSITVEQSIISISDSPYDRCVILRSDLLLVNQIRTVSHNCCGNLRQLHLIRTSLSHQTLRDAVHALVLSRLDHCNVLYAGAPDYLVNRLKILINTATRVISGRSHFSPITGYVRDVQH